MGGTRPEVLIVPLKGVTAAAKVTIGVEGVTVEEEEEEEDDDDEVVFESVENFVETTIFTNPKLDFLTTKRGRRAKARIKAEGIFGYILKRGYFGIKHGKKESNRNLEDATNI